MSCVRRLADDALRGWTPFSQQTRNASAMKKKKEAMNNIPVRLLEDLKEYGRKGSHLCTRTIFSALLTSSTPRFNCASCPG